MTKDNLFLYGRKIGGGELSTSFVGKTQNSQLEKGGDLDSRVNRVFSKAFHRLKNPANIMRTKITPLTISISSQNFPTDDLPFASKQNKSFVGLNMSRPHLSRTEELTDTKWYLNQSLSRYSERLQSKVGVDKELSDETIILDELTPSDELNSKQNNLISHASNSAYHDFVARKSGLKFSSNQEANLRNLNVDSLCKPSNGNWAERQKRMIRANSRMSKDSQACERYFEVLGAKEGHKGGQVSNEKSTSPVVPLELSGNKLFENLSTIQEVSLTKPVSGLASRNIAEISRGSALFLRGNDGNMGKKGKEGRF